MRIISQGGTERERRLLVQLGGLEEDSRDTAVMIGRIMTAEAMPATSIVRPVADTGPAKNGNREPLVGQVAKPTEPGPAPPLPASRRCWARRHKSTR